MAFLGRYDVGWFSNGDDGLEYAAPNGAIRCLSWHHYKYVAPPELFAAAVSFFPTHPVLRR